MIANVLIEIYGNSSAINVLMAVYVMIIHKTLQDDGYDYLQNHYLHFEHAGQDYNFVVNKKNLVIKSDENHCEMARSAETNDLFEKIDWGNESSMNYFLMENQSKHAGIQSVVSNATKHQDLKKGMDYHLLGTSLFNSLTAIGPYLAHRFFWASFKVNNFLNFCPLTIFDSSKCS
jgi:hypothetical protein